MLYHRLIIGLHYSLGHHGIDFVTKFTEEQITVSLLNSQKMETILNRIFFLSPRSINADAGYQTNRKHDWFIFLSLYVNSTTDAKSKQNKRELCVTKLIYSSRDNRKMNRVFGDIFRGVTIFLPTSLVFLAHVLVLWGPFFGFFTQPGSLLFFFFFFFILSHQLGCTIGLFSSVAQCFYLHSFLLLPSHS